MTSCSETSRSFEKPAETATVVGKRERSAKRRHRAGKGGRRLQVWTFFFHFDSFVHQRSPH